MRPPFHSQFPGLNDFWKANPSNSKRRLLLAVVEINGDEVVGVEKVFSGTDIAQFENLPKEIYEHIVTLVEKLEDKKKALDRPKKLEEKNAIEI